MKNVWYIGELPPPYGGVTVKNKLVYQHVYEPIGAKFIDLMICKRNPIMAPAIALEIIYSMIFGHKIIIGVGGTSRRKKLLRLQKFICGKKGLRKVILIGMGGQMHVTDTRDSMMTQMLSSLDSVWVEADGMIAELNKKGIQNAKLFPNCRTATDSQAPKKRDNGKLKLVFFSRICVEKGVDLIIDAYKELPPCVTLDIYGEVAKEYKQEFEQFLVEYPEVNYHGVFDATKNNVYEELNKYDVELLPTKWIGEGVPGALVESKMAGITAIVSDWGFNNEVIINGVEGIVLDENSVDKLIIAIEKMLYDKDLLDRLKNGAYHSRMRYCIETYRDELRKSISK